MSRMSPGRFWPALIFLGVLMYSPQVVAQDEAPANLQAALFLKILPMCTNLGSEPFSIHVVGAPKVAAEFKELIGKTVGKASLAGVTEGSGPPSSPTKVVYVGDKAGDLTQWSQANGALSITGKPALVNEGVTLGVGIEGGKPKILLNLSSTKAEKINWNPQILKVAATVE